MSLASPQPAVMYERLLSSVTLGSLREVLYARLRCVGSGVKRGPGPSGTTTFDISVANVRANRAYVVGKVNQPGTSRSPRC